MWSVQGLWTNQADITEVEQAERSRGDGFGLDEVLQDVRGRRLDVTVVLTDRQRDREREQEYFYLIFFYCIFVYPSILCWVVVKSLRDCWLKCPWVPWKVQYKLNVLLLSLLWGICKLGDTGIFLPRGYCKHCDWFCGAHLSVSMTTVVNKHGVYRRMFCQEVTKTDFVDVYGHVLPELRQTGHKVNPSRSPSSGCDAQSAALTCVAIRVFGDSPEHAWNHSCLAWRVCVDHVCVLSLVCLEGRRLTTISSSSS